MIEMGNGCLPLRSSLLSCGSFETTTLATTVMRSRLWWWNVRIHQAPTLNLQNCATPELSNSRRVWTSGEQQKGLQLEAKALAGGVVALGKFDALHVGHRALAEHAAEIGAPFLVSFAGMAEVLGWEVRLPVVARCDRARVMSLWAEHCGDVVPQEYMLEFSKVRSLSPEQFVEKLASELKVKGVVAGANYRFGYKAAGDASDLVRLCQEYGLQSAIVNPIMDASEMSSPVLVDDSSREKGQVSTTRVRKALANGDMKRVAELLGRRHRLVIRPDKYVRRDNLISVPAVNALNQPPRIGSYECSFVLEGAGATLDSDSLAGNVRLEESCITLELQQPSLVDTITQQNLIVLDFLA
ncbi:FAD synthetase 2, chloroplastic [Physcomitrium patens]|uniref:FAD synthase n=1 Tax=Physcomitrium patens TaxID=3218 RepID=A0A2K1KLF7_PHYPA|nr:FAD synthetase 2, chloroplastic-like [Physcomitrium patens]XP_024377061.1 FAD synthetase 2, chloroplastic-like [Physcomitrium patens]PNR54605.1 hypothetical protein PHYPA_008282 [Physcomitrium patens]|eukprot:XP_024377060.1 FAD synthetase 2, chloroplastic-like [Physcomitrella patens]